MGNTYRKATFGEWCKISHFHDSITPISITTNRKSKKIDWEYFYEQTFLWTTKYNKYVFATQWIRLQWALAEIEMVNVCVEVARKKSFTTIWHLTWGAICSTNSNQFEFYLSETGNQFVVTRRYEIISAIFSIEFIHLLKMKVSHFFIHHWKWFLPQK